MAEFILIALVSIFVTVVADMAMMKTSFGGIDFMFYGPWVVALSSFSSGVLLAFIVLLAHAFVRNRIAHYILLSFPAQLLAIIIGAVFGANGFWLALIAYFCVLTIIGKFVGALGGKYFSFVAVAVTFNIILFSSKAFL